MEVNISIDESLKQIIRLGCVQFDQVKVTTRHEAIVNENDELVMALRARYSSPADAMEKLNITRSLYRNIGIDPTKNRSSSEALLRRVLKGNTLYQVNSIVDICNLCSLNLLLSLGLYDVDSIKGRIKLRLGKKGESYDGIRKEQVNVTGRFTLIDDLGPFGNPSADSARTMITESTTHLLFVIFAPSNYDEKVLTEHLDFIEGKVAQYHPCQTVVKKLV